MLQSSRKIYNWGENENLETKDDDCTMVYGNNSKYNLRQRKIESYVEEAESTSVMGLFYWG